MDSVSRGWRTPQAGALRGLSACHFDVVDGCQLRCVGCPISTLQPKIRRISVEDFGLCLGNIDVKAIQLLRLFNYGEAFLHPELPALLLEIPKQKWRVRNVELSTNGQSVSPAKLEAVIRTGVLTRLVLSCDGDGTAEDYERLRPPSRWSQLLAFLKRAADLRDRFQPRLELMTRTICTDPEGQARWLTLLEPLGWRPEFRSWLTLPDAALDVAHQAPGEGLCGFQTRHDALYVSASGEVVPCCYHPRAAVLGDLKSQTFNEIMVGERRTAFSRRMRADRAGMPVCGGCPAPGTIDA